MANWRAGTAFLIVCVFVAGCPPRPRRPIDAGDGAVEDAIADAQELDAADGGTDASDTIDAPRERPPIPDVVFDEDGALSGPEVPPRGHAAIAPWLNFGSYRMWSCQRAPHPAPIPSAHAYTRVCLNAQWINTLPSQPFPVGAASVKELYDASLRTITGFAVMLKVGPGNTPADWYWYQRVPAGSMNPMLPVPITPEGIVADGVADRPGNERTICASCHSTAGEVGRTGHHFGFTTNVDDY